MCSKKDNSMARAVKRLVVGQQYIDKSPSVPKAFFLIKVKYIDKRTRRPAISRLAKITRKGVTSDIYPLSGGYEFQDDAHTKRTYNKHEFIKFIYKKIDTEF